MGKSNRWLGLLLGALVSTHLHAQLSSVEAGVAAGNMLDIYPNMPDHTIQFARYLAVRFSGTDPYQPLYGMPQHGALLSVHDLGNRSQLGWGIGLQYQATFDQSIGKHWSTTQAFNLGGIYVTKPYHPITNSSNIVFGSHFSALISASAGIRYQWYRQVFSAQASYWHSSNAHTTLPNVGMNTPMVMLSVEYLFHNYRHATMDTTLGQLHLPNRWSAQLFGSWGTNEAGGTVRPTNGDSYHKYLGAIGAAYRVNTIHRLSISVEGYYDQTYALWNETMEWKNNNPQLQSSALMCMVGHEFIYGRFGLLVQAGVNIYNPTLDRLIGEVERPTTMNRIKRYVPGRFALRYYLNPHETSFASCFAQAAVKSNLGQADFLEIGVGVLISGRSTKTK